jgi:hypothetical protein
VVSSWVRDGYAVEVKSKKAPKSGQEE